MTDPISLGGSGGSSRPQAAKLAEPGHQMVFAIFNAEELPLTEIGTGKILYKDNGKERMQKVLSGIYMSGDAVTNKDGGTSVVEIGEQITIYLPGHKYGSYIDAEKALGGSPNVGDVVLVKYTGDEPSGFGPNSMKKVWSIAIRRHDPAKDGAMLSTCVAAYHAANAVEPIPASQPANAPAAAAPPAQAQPAAAADPYHERFAQQGMTDPAPAEQESAF